jgi:hypothetical protein
MKGDAFVLDTVVLISPALSAGAAPAKGVAILAPAAMWELISEPTSSVS